LSTHHVNYRLRSLKKLAATTQAPYTSAASTMRGRLDRGSPAPPREELIDPPLKFTGGKKAIGPAL
jgi:hypothetical protein